MIIRLAEKRIAFYPLYPYVGEYCQEYRISEEPDADLSFHIRQQDIDFERSKSEQEDLAEGREVRKFSDEYLEILAVYRKIAEWTPTQDIFLFHGSCVAVDGTGYLFTAKSGTGKSTHTRLWRELLGERAVMINDDKPLIRVNEDGSAVVYGTPWDGKHRLSRNLSVPLKAICVLERAEENRIRAVKKREIYPMLLQQSYRPADPVALAKTLMLLDRLNVEVYRLGCNMELSAAKLSYNTMSAKARSMESEKI